MHIFEVGTRKLRVQKFAARKGLRVLTRLAGIIGPAIAETAGDGDAGDKLPKAIRAAVENLTEKQVDWLVDEFSEQTTCDLTGKGAYVKLSIGDVFEQIFGTDYAAIFGWLLFCLELNFAGFLASIGSRFARGPAKAESSSESPTP